MTSKTRAFRTSPSRVYEAALAAARACGWEIAAENRGKGTFKASSGVSIQSWGEEIVISVLAAPDGSTVVQADSEASLQVFDWGKSAENLNRFYGELERALS